MIRATLISPGSGKSDVDEFVRGAVVRAVDDIDVGVPVFRPLLKGDLLHVSNVMALSGLFDAISFIQKPVEIYVSLFIEDFEILNEMEVLALASQDSGSE